LSANHFLASLLPPAVNCGLLFAYALLGASFSNVAAVHSPSLNHTQPEYRSISNCSAYINNDYHPLYTCDLATEASILGSCSLLLTIVNIICIIIMALFILRIKEVVPLHQPNKDIANFFHYDVKVARDYNKTIHEGDLEANNLATLTINRGNIAQSIVNRWKSFKSVTSHDNQQQQGTGELSSSASNDGELTDTESRRKLLHLKTFAKEYDLDVFDKHDYDLLNSDSREKVRLLVRDLVDICQEIPSVFVNLFQLQPCATQAATEKEQMSFYQEIIELLPPKWYQLFVREQQRREIKSLSSTFNRTYSLRAPRFDTYRKSMSETHAHDLYRSFKKQPHKSERHILRQTSVPEPRACSPRVNQETEIPVKGTRFRIAKPSATTPQTSGINEE
jgi:hypothetical protein